MTSPLRNWTALALFCCGLACSGVAGAQGFSALVSPPRFEANAKPGDTYRNVIEIGNASDSPAHFAVQTADWTLKPDAGIEFSDALAPDSCRTWVGLEAAEVNLAPNGKRRFRFEVRVPADAPSGECRFAIMVEGDPSTPAGGAVPVAGRIGVIVYLAIGDAAPNLQVTGYSVRTVDGSVVPVLTVRNDGNAHGRLQGFVDGTDAGGKRYAFAPTTLPILAGETRDIALMPQADKDDQPPPVLTWPVRIQGKLDSGKQRIDLEQTFSQ